VTFSSLPFAAFLGALLLAMAIFRATPARRLILLAGGVFFYGYWNWKFLALISFTSVFDYFMGLRIAAAQGRARRLLLLLDVCVNLGLLAAFKYLKFLVENLNLLLAPLHLHLPAVALPLPIGISFFVFEAMSYCIDIYRGKIEPYRNWLHFALFIFFFPRMVAGPIIRAADFLPQVRDRLIRFTAANVNRAACIFLLGLVKKVLIADRMAMLVDPVFAHPAAFDTATVWLAVVGYAIQIFCDFSGYTDMAIALARLFGFDLPLNFNLPYLAPNITEFWRRWHISLSSWLRDYLYISLGGNRLGEARTYANLILTMLLGGLWHGASWNFVVWGGLHGVALAVHKLFGAGRRPGGPIGRLLGTAGTFLFVCLCWVFFRAPHFAEAWILLRKMAGLGGPGVRWLYEPFWPALAAMVAWHLLRRNTNEHGEIPLLSTAGQVLLWSALWLFWLAAPLAAQPFIYFQF
jgi:alginate O-acetyltransferase complex protein AlgI